MSKTARIFKLQKKKSKLGAYENYRFIDHQAPGIFILFVKVLKICGLQKFSLMQPC